MNRVAALYWLDARNSGVARNRRRLQHGAPAFAADAAVGLWWEPVVVDAPRMETITFKEFRRGFSGCPHMGLTSTDQPAIGARRAIAFPAPRTIASSRRSRPRIAGAASGVSYRAIVPPKNLCVIRSGVSWEKCEGEQLKDYQQRIKPKLDAGMSYLRNNPRETGCFSLRQVDCIDGDGRKLAEGYSLGAFVSMGHLEAWSKDHPSHLAIYTSALAARKKYQDKLQLHTYNEIFILDDGNPPFEYFNCHPQTGLLPFAGVFDNHA